MVFVLDRKDLLKLLKSSLASLRKLKVTSPAYIDDLITVYKVFFNIVPKLKICWFDKDIRVCKTSCKVNIFSNAVH